MKSSEPGELGGTDVLPGGEWEVLEQEEDGEGMALCEDNGGGEEDAGDEERWDEARRAA